MTDYHLVLSSAARRDLKGLPKDVQKAVALFHLPQIERKPYEAGVPLIGALRGERSYHFGRRPEYRIIYMVEDDAIIVTLMGTRENIYKKASRRK